ncbi:hypothetical protein F5051DRAFT_46909 [Lentinula edodes]|nr:hypothetical protein F5051DRAFT_46909 [Lentinula edodes]KAJ3891034.1 hypothetical protein GG344DRAFT_77306 [Lentinula edodes]
MYLNPVFLSLWVLASMIHAIPINPTHAILNTISSHISSFKEYAWPQPIIHIHFLPGASGEPYYEPYPNTVQPAGLVPRIRQVMAMHFQFVDSSWQFRFRNGYNGSEELTGFTVNFTGPVDESCMEGSWCTMDM